jgi:Mg2+/Co2+ transporter CorB
LVTLEDILEEIVGEFTTDMAASNKDINGLLTEALESIPDSSIGIDLHGYYAEIVQVKDNVIRTVRMWKSVSGT